MEILNRAYTLLNEWYRSTTPGARRTAGALAIVIVISLGYGYMHRETVEIELLPNQPITATELTAMKAAFATARLNTYEIRGEHSIYVPRDERTAYMDALTAAKALPANFDSALVDVLKNDSFLKTPDQRFQEIKVAQERQTAMCIRSMNGIENAWVQCDVDTKPGLQREKSMKVLVTVRPAGSTILNADQVSNIRHAVVGRWTSLNLENVTVLDLNSGHTWYGTAETNAAGGNACLAMQRKYEQELKAKILDSLSGFIPNVNVEVCVTLDRDRIGSAATENVALTPKTARASIVVPSTYFKTIWQERSSADENKALTAADQTAIDRVRDQETLKIKKHVAQLLPAVDGILDPTQLVAVTSLDVSAPIGESSRAAWQRGMGAWFKRNGGAVALGTLALVSLFVLRSMVRAGTAEMQTVPYTAAAASDDGSLEKDRLESSASRRVHTNSATADRDELSDMVRRDPGAAAGVLRTWIGNAG